MYLFALYLRCGMWDLQMQRANSQLWHVGSLDAACQLLAVACGIQFPDQGVDLASGIGNAGSQPRDFQRSPTERIFKCGAEKQPSARLLQIKLSHSCLSIFSFFLFVHFFFLSYFGVCCSRDAPLPLNTLVYIS